MTATRSHDEMPSPAYMRIRQYVVGLINRANGKAEKIMSLRKLCAAFAVSLPTARKALETLIAEKYLVTVHGVGTFINPNAPVMKGNEPCVGVVFGGGAQVNIEPLELIAGLLKALGKHFYPIRIISVADLKRDPEKIADELARYSLNGLAWVMPRGPALDVLRCLQERKFPVIALEQYNDCPGDINQVATRPGSIEEAAARYLLDSGAKRAIYLGPPWEERIAAFAEVFARAGCPLDRDALIADPKDTGMPKALEKLVFEEGVTDIFSHGGPRLEKVFAFVRKALKRGIAVRLVTPWARDAAKAPELVDAFIVAPAEEIGVTAGRRLGQLIIDGWAGPSAVFLEPALEINKNHYAIRGGMENERNCRS